MILWSPVEWVLRQTVKRLSIAIIDRQKNSLFTTSISLIQRAIQFEQTKAKLGHVAELIIKWHGSYVQTNDRRSGDQTTAGEGVFAYSSYSAHYASSWCLFWCHTWPAWRSKPVREQSLVTWERKIAGCLMSKLRIASFGTTDLSMMQSYWELRLVVAATTPTTDCKT